MVVEPTHLQKYDRQIGSFPQAMMNIEKTFEITTRYPKMVVQNGEFHPMGSQIRKKIIQAK